MRINVISMGCSKNLVDSERLMKRLEAKGHTLIHNPEEPEGDWAIVNTCGFIGDAKEESINLLLALGQLKETGQIRHLAVMGCLSQRYREELKELIPEIDRFYGKFDWDNFINELPEASSLKISDNPKNWERRLTTPPWQAYLKISEGCNRFCAFCAIPLITGRHTSRPIDEILDETRDLCNKGVKEFNIIAQDLSSYGIDLYGKHSLATLIEKMSDIVGPDAWIRLHYAYPSDFPDDILDVINARDNVCAYMDIALQHISDNVLQRMRRHISSKETIRLIENIRRKCPQIKLRTTMLVGFPGETEQDFLELLDFVKNTRFERLGAFAYSEEEGTFAAENYKDDVPENIKQVRLETLLETQREISEELNQAAVGQTMKVIVDSVEPDGTVIARSQWDSPEVDQEIYVSGTNAQPGDFLNVVVTGYAPYELYAEPLNN